MKPTCLGNSHTMMFSQSHPSSQYGEGEFFVSHRLGACTAWSFKKHMDKIKSMNIDGPCLLILGEIDLRFHALNEAIKQRRHRYDILKEIINVYWERVMEIGPEKSIVWAPHPCRNEPSDNPESPIMGPPELRNDLVLFWNELIKHKCQVEGIPFISIVEKLINYDLTTKEEYLSDYCHLNEKAYKLMIEEFKKKGLIE